MNNPLIIGFIIFVVIVWLTLAVAVFNKRDSTDKSFWNRSGLTLYVDNETGLHYIKGSTGSIIPRLDIHGKHMRDKLL